MSDILCIYYSRTGNTKKAMEEIAAALDAELAELRDNEDVDMFTTVFVGNEQTRLLDGKMVTPRGYLQREG